MSRRSKSRDEQNGPGPHDDGRTPTPDLDDPLPWYPVDEECLPEEGEDDGRRDR